MSQNTRSDIVSFKKQTKEDMCCPNLTATKRARFDGRKREYFLASWSIIHALAYLLLLAGSDLLKALHDSFDKFAWRSSLKRLGGEVTPDLQEIGCQILGKWFTDEGSKGTREPTLVH
jgi:hypothetical protein